MFFRQRIAYSVLVAIAMIVPAWGCSEPPPTPDDIKQATGDLKDVTVEMGSETKEGSDTEKDTKEQDTDAKSDKP